MVLVVQTVAGLTLREMEQVRAGRKHLALGEHGLARHGTVQFDAEEGLDL